MREHLYKAIRKDNCGWVQGYYAYDYRLNNHLLFSNSVGAYNAGFLPKRDDYNLELHVIEPETVCQFIKEVNKHRIFESDIVKAYMHGDLETQPFIYPIEYRNGTYWFGNWTWLEFLNVMRFVEVIGNVHDKEVVK